MEVCHNNKWGTVCNDYWDSNEATVACKQLGFHAYIDYYTYAYYGSGTGSIWLDNLQSKEMKEVYSYALEMELECIIVIIMKM